MTADQNVNFNYLYQMVRAMDQVQSVDAWMRMFDTLAARIMVDLQPKTVLDAGCGRGYLVKSLRARGVEAWGIDRSADTIQNALPESQPFCQVGSILEPLPQGQYDLIVCINVVEHISPDDAGRALENLCRHSDDILFSSIPLARDGSEPNTTQPPEYWAALFARAGFIHDFNFDTSFISPWAMRFLKTQLSEEERLKAYERKIGQLSQEVTLRQNLGVEYKKALSANEMELQHQLLAVKQLQEELDAIRMSNSWKLITRLQRVRERVIPLGSRREMLMHSAFYCLRVVRREGILGFPVLVYQKSRTALTLKTNKLYRKMKLRRSATANSGHSSEITGIVERPKFEVHITSVDIIICVHNALDDVQRCLESLLEHTTQPYHMILVDDGSDDATAGYLRQFANAHQASLLRSDTATGYPRAANRGMHESSAEFLVLLNSDTILTPEWLDRMIACIQNDPKVGMVGPLSNTASWQSVPKIEQSGDWAANPLPAGLSTSGMAQLIASKSARLYVDMPLLNGFCLMVRRKLLAEAGLFDEASFGEGYGEEDDLVLRARKLGWKMALADDVFIYHAQSKSYSNDRRRALADRAQKNLRQKHGDRIISEGVHYCLQDPVLEGIRARIQVINDRDQYLFRGKQFSGKSLLFVLPINSPGGGANVIRSEMIALHQMGINVKFFNLEAHRKDFTESYPDLSALTIFGEPEDLDSAAQHYDAVIATFNITVSWLKPLASKTTHPLLGYYIQGFEPWMYSHSSLGYKNALESYNLIDDMTLFCKTEWTRQQVKDATGRESKVIGASVDIDLYRPRSRNIPVWPNGPIRIAAMIRPESPYREPQKTMKLLYETSRKYKGQVDILLFGTPYENPAFQALIHDFPFTMYGVLRPEQVANLLSQVDIFVDYSSQQAMGLTAMEAMACGSAVIVPQFGGAASYAIHEHNSLVVDTSSFGEMLAALHHLIDDDTLRTNLQRNAIHDICNYFPERAALNMLDVLFIGDEPLRSS